MNSGNGKLRLFLGGDVMTGRGIDQVLRRPSDPRLFESWVRDARDYVRLAERASGPIPRGVAEGYVWGDLLEDLESLRPDLRIVNLETAITRSGAAEPKGINYRMHPDNAGVLSAAGIDLCILANNHVMDWGAEGLADTLQALGDRGIVSAGAGATAPDAWRPCVLPAGGGRRLIVAAFAAADCGVPAHWAAGRTSPGIAMLPDPPERLAETLRAQLAGLRRAGDALVVSIHWGGNWGYDVPAWQSDLAHALIETCGADVVFGHSSHHPKAAEFYRGGLILYGCGDLINDYEGIGGHDAFPTTLALGYFVDVDPTGGQPTRCRMRPYRIRKFRLGRAGKAASRRLAEILMRECAKRGTDLVQEEGGDLLAAAG